jgi:protein-L-isoaspartate(D-aspartate) O-methyltransferase
VILRWFGEYVPTPSADPVYLYIDSVVQVVAERHLNNGQPSGHAIWITRASIKAGEPVVHIGTGTGYYTAIPSGKVTGIELDASPHAPKKTSCRIQMCSSSMERARQRRSMLPTSFISTLA